MGPIFTNKPTQSDTTDLYGHSAGYHGYWIEDFLNVDPHLGTNAEFARLVDEAHDRGMKVVMDIVTNHTADVIQLEGNAGYRNKRDFPYRDVTGEPFDDSDFAYSGQSDYSFPEVNATRSRTHQWCRPGEANAKNPAWLNDPLLYHNRGNTSFTGENSLYGDFFGLDDLWTERREVVEGMVDIYSFWIEEFGVDGFRIDTTKHVNMEFWQKFGPDILARPRRGHRRLLRLRRGVRPAVRPAVHERVLDHGPAPVDDRLRLPARGAEGSPPRAHRPTRCATSSLRTTTTPMLTATPTPCRRSSGTTTWDASATSCSASTSPALPTPSCWPGPGSRTP